MKYHWFRKKVEWQLTGSFTVNVYLDSKFWLVYLWTGLCEEHTGSQIFDVFCFDTWMSIEIIFLLFIHMYSGNVN